MATREYPDLPLVGIGAVVVREGRVLLVRRAKPPRRGEWSLPGGLQKLGETVFDAIRREVMEEAGILVQPMTIVDVVDLIERDHQRVRFHYTLIDVLALWMDGEAVAGADAAEVMWVDPAEVTHKVGWSETARVVDRACRIYAGQASGVEMIAPGEPSAV